MKKSGLAAQLLPHVCIVLSVVMMTFFVIDRLNEPMKFIDNDITKWMLCVLCVCSFTVSVMLCRHQRHE